MFWLLDAAIMAGSSTQHRVFFLLRNFRGNQRLLSCEKRRVAEDAKTPSLIHGNLGILGVRYKPALPVYLQIPRLSGK